MLGYLCYLYRLADTIFSHRMLRLTGYVFIDLDCLRCTVTVKPFKVSDK